MALNKECSFGIASDLYVAGLTEDGDEFIAEKYRVYATDADGNRWAHASVFCGCEVVDCEDHWGFRDVRDQAIAKAERLLARIERAVDVCDAYWSETRPEYGSLAYEQYGAADDCAWEKKHG